jgi:hypothetical protein
MAVEKQEITQVTSNLPAYAQPYFEDLLNRAKEESNRKLPLYSLPRSADIDFTPAQKQIHENIMGLTAPNQIAAGSGLTTAAGLGSLAMADYTPGQFTTGFNPSQFSAGYNPSQFASDYNSGQFTTGFKPGEFSVQGLGNLGNVRDVNAERVQADKMQAAQTQFQANLERFQMAAPDRFDQAQAEQYMSPYIRNVLDTQKREAVRDARQGQIVQDLGAARQGTYGGSRQLLAGLERERNLGQQLGDIEARGLQGAFESSQGQFERDRTAQMAAQQANLQAALGVQELGTTTGLQTALANLSNEQQARVQNMAAENQMRGMNAENALRAALANQQADIGVRGQNLQGAMQTQQLGLEAQRLGEQSRQFDSTQGLEAQRLSDMTRQFGSNQRLEAQRLNDAARQFGSQQNLEAQRLSDMSRQFGSNQGLEAQRLGEQSRQFGTSTGLAALGQAGQMGQTLGNLGQLQQNMDAQRLGMQAAAAGEYRTMAQQQADQKYNDFLRQRDEPVERLGYYSNILRGLPVTPNSTRTTYGESPSAISQVTGAGIAGLGAYNTFRGG